MPHITIEYSANIADQHDVDALVAAIHAAALADGLPAADALRTRAAVRDHYRIADGHPDNAFVAIHVRVGPGRNVVTRQRFINAVLDAAEAQLETEPSSLAIAWSIEIAEIDKVYRVNRNHVRTRMNERGTSDG